MKFLTRARERQINKKIRQKVILYTQIATIDTGRASSYRNYIDCQTVEGKAILYTPELRGVNPEPV